MPSSIGNVVGGLFGGDAPSAPNVQTWQPGGTKAFDTMYQDLATQQVKNNPYAQYAPQAETTFEAQYNNPYATGYQNAATAAGQQYGVVGGMDAANAAAMSGAGNSALAAGQNVLNMGMDPQGELYARMVQQLNDQVNARNAASGVTSSPYGASVGATANSNFNIDWQNQQLDRAIKALSSYTGASTSAGNDFTTAGALGESGAANTAKTGALPFAASTDITSSQNNALSQLMGMLGSGGAGGWDTQSLNTLLNYMNLGADQANQQGNFDLKNYQAQLDAANASAKGLGTLASSLSNIVGGASNAGSIGNALKLLSPSSGGGGGGSSNSIMAQIAALAAQAAQSG